MNKTKLRQIIREEIQNIENIDEGKIANTLATAGGLLAAIPGILAVLSTDSRTVMANNKGFGALIGWLAIIGGWAGYSVGDKVENWLDNFPDIDKKELKAFRKLVETALDDVEADMIEVLKEKIRREDINKYREKKGRAFKTATNMSNKNLPDSEIKKMATIRTRYAKKDFLAGKPKKHNSDQIILIRLVNDKLNERPVIKKLLGRIFNKVPYDAQMGIKQARQVVNK